MRFRVSWLALLLACLGLVACSSIERRSDTPEKQPLTAIVSMVELEPVWQQKALAGVGPRDEPIKLAITNNGLVAADHTGQVVALKQADGQVIWRTTLPHGVTAGPTVAGDSVFVATHNASIVQLKLHDGALGWQAPATSEVLAAPAVSADAVFIHSLDGGITALDRDNGRQIWRFSSNLPVLILRRNSTPVITEDHVIAGFANGKLVALKRVDGSVDWTQDVSNPKGRSDLQRMVDISANPQVVNNRVYAASYRGNVAAYVQVNGQPIWQREAGSYSGFVLGPGSQTLYLSSYKGEIWAFDAANGETFWVQPQLQGRRLSQPAVMDDWVFVGDEDGYLHVLDRRRGELVGRYLLMGSEGIEAQPVVLGRTLTVLGRSGVIAKFKVKSLKKVKPATKGDVT